MKNNDIRNDNVLIYNGELRRHPDRSNSHLIVLIKDEYVKSKNYQKLMREKKQFSIGGNLLYQLLTELFDYISHLFDRIRLEDLNLDEGNKTLLFLKKFAYSSDVIERKLSRLDSLNPAVNSELFVLHIAGLENSIQFSRQSDGNSKLEIEIPVSFIYNRLISFVDKMEFGDLLKIDQDVKKSFLMQFKELNRKILDHKKQIEMKYALDLAQERARDLEIQYAALMERNNQLRFQNDLYKRSYFSLKNRYRAIIMKINGGSTSDNDENLEEL